MAGLTDGFGIPYFTNDPAAGKVSPSIVWDYGSFLRDAPSINVLLTQSSINPYPDDQSTLGTVFFWIGFGITGFPALLFFFLTLRREETKRRFHYAMTTAMFVSMLAYYCMARKQGGIALYDQVATGGEPSYRVFYYARYVDWAISSPLIILNLCMLAGATRALTAGLMFSDFLMIVAGLLGALSVTGTKWGWFAFACCAFVPILVALCTVLRKYAREKAPEAEKCYTWLLIITAISWFGYPIIWIIATGTHAISVNAEIVAFTCVDLFAKTVFSFILLFSSSAIEDGSFKDPEKMELPTQYTQSTIYTGVLKS
eukprot:CAMPEP_0196652320 /NCGR_PEP_ID=MMETSP1086-20130531/1566_1 /TAXON_ID=77921 /ORGANISM="Cyanoptyche  gloeocystis , Strain SAG4.97" /LENGTH=313 /DNA_ID=CAMNT_0041982791 /DNA_START=47 /DNA_END=988 /DNA_ORIENTATION=+